MKAFLVLGTDEYDVLDKYGPSKKEQMVLDLTAGTVVHAKQATRLKKIEDFVDAFVTVLDGNVYAASIISDLTEQQLEYFIDYQLPLLEMSDQVILARLCAQVYQVLAKGAAMVREFEKTLEYFQVPVYEIFEQVCGVSDENRIRRKIALMYRAYAFWIGKNGIYIIPWEEFGKRVPLVRNEQRNMDLWEEICNRMVNGGPDTNAYPNPILIYNSVPRVPSIVNAPLPPEFVIHIGTDAGTMSARVRTPLPVAFFGMNLQMQGHWLGDRLKSALREFEIDLQDYFVHPLMNLSKQVSMSNPVVLIDPDDGELLIRQIVIEGVAVLTPFRNGHRILVQHIYISKDGGMPDLYDEPKKFGRPFYIGDKLHITCSHSFECFNPNFSIKVLFLAEERGDRKPKPKFLLGIYLYRRISE